MQSATRPTASDGRSTVYAIDVSEIIAVSNATRFGECEDARFSLDYLLGRVLVAIGAYGVDGADISATNRGE
jgi:hypothetical protein